MNLSVIIQTFEHPDYNPPSAGLKYIDHMVGNVGCNQMNKWVKWYEDVMGFENFLSFDDKQIHESRNTCQILKNLSCKKSF